MRIRIVPSDQETLEEKRKRKQQKGKKRAKKVAKRKTKKKGKDDRCTRIAKRKYDVWPSAYASGAVVKCRQGKIWKGISEGKEESALDRAKKEVLGTLKDEGGAAGLEPLEDALSDVEDLPDDFDIEEFLADLSDEEVKKHEHGDYIGMRGLNEAKKKRKKKRKKAGTESSKESSLHDWFKRRGAKGKKGGWVDCNAPDGKGGYKPCGRQKGEKRKKYPACRPTPGACKERGKGKSWGKKAKKRKKMKESAEEYVYGVKNPGRVGNIYTIKVVKK